MGFLRLNMKLRCPIIKKVNRRLLNLTTENLPARTSCAFRLCSNSPNVESRNSESSPSFATFSEMVSRRRAEASRSFLVETLYKNNFVNICEICERIGPIKAAFNYTLNNGKEVFLVECDSLEMLQEVLKSCRYSRDVACLPVHSRLLRFSSKFQGSDSTADTSALLKGFKPRKDFICNSMSEQMERLYLNERLPDLGVRSRFLICRQIEDLLIGLFPHAEVLPFGSCVNGFGRKNCDLDMILHLQNVDLINANSNLYFNVKKNQILNERAQSQQILETVADMMRTFIPGFTDVHKILKARIPIIEFNHSLMGVECDLSANNLCAVYMTELLYLYGELDSRVRHLVFTIRIWAKANDLTHKFPGHWISNFSLTLMVLFFLQNRPKPILPSLNKLVQLSDPDDARIAEGINCTFQRKAHKIPKAKNSEDAGDLLLEFFRFFEKFNFHKHAMSLKDGKSIVKPTSSSLYIENPLEPQLNVSYNVNIEETVHLTEAMRSAIWILESNSSPSEKNSWGIMKLFEGTNTDSNSKKAVLKVKGLLDEVNSKAVHYVASSDGQSKRKKLLTTLGVINRVAETPSANRKANLNVPQEKKDTTKRENGSRKRLPRTWTKW